MIRLILAILSINALADFSVAQNKRKVSSINLRSTQEIVFHDKKDLGFSDMGKIPEYQGKLVFLNENNLFLGEPSLYKFKFEGKNKNTLSLCENIVDKLFGPASQRALKLQGQNILFDTKTGQACASQLKDEYVHARQPYRYTIVGFIHANLYSLVWSFHDKPTESQIQKMQSFWKSLK